MDPYILIAKYYSSEISEQEKATLDIWRRESEENERIFQESGDCWNISGAVYQDFSESFMHAPKVRKNPSPFT